MVLADDTFSSIMVTAAGQVHNPRVSLPSPSQEVAKEASDMVLADDNFS